MSRNILVAGLLFVSAVGGCSGGPGEAPVQNTSPGSEPLSFQRGIDCMEYENWRGASDLFERTIQDHPDYLEAYWNLADCYVQLGRQSRSYFEKAQGILDQISSRVPEEDRRLLKAQARLHIFTGRVDDALAMYEEVLAKEPENCEFWTLYGTCQRAKSDELIETEGPEAGVAMLDEALLSYEQATTACPDYFDAHEGKAAILIQRKLYDDVVVIYTDLKEKYPDEESVLRMFTLAQFRARNWALAAEAFEELLVKSPRPSDHLNYAAVLRKLDRIPEAEEQVRLYEQVAPRLEGPVERTRMDMLRDELNIQESATRASSLMDEKKFDEAIAVWNEAVDRVRPRLDDPDYEEESRELLVWLERRVRYTEDLKRRSSQ